MNEDMNWNNPDSREFCGCNQGMNNYLQKQRNDKMEYSVIKKSMQNDMNYENENYSVSYNYIPNLPVESRRFQTISASLGNNWNLCLDAWNVRAGTDLRNGLTNRYCRVVANDYQVLIYALNPDVASQYFIFYQTDDGSFVIASQNHGRVFDLRNGIWANLYNGNDTQRFRKINNSINDFRILANNNWSLDACDGLFIVTSML